MKILKEEIISKKIKYFNFNVLITHILIKNNYLKVLSSAMIAPVIFSLFLLQLFLCQ